MDLTVIIVSYNVSDFLKQCLISVRRAVDSIECEVFVVDNHSSDGSCNMVKEEFPEVKLILNNTNSGFSRANNQAIKKANGKYVLLLNPDTVVESGTFSKCIGFMNGHPDAGAMAARMINGEGRYLPESKRAFPTPLTAFFKTFGLSALFPRSQFFNKYYLTHINPNETALTEVISGAFMFIRMEALLKAGLLDEDYFMYGEDIDLSYRITRSGYNNYYLPEASIIHFKGMSTARDRFTDLYHFYTAMRIYARKRNQEKFSLLYYLIIMAIYFREGIALCNRFIRIKLLR